MALAAPRLAGLAAAIGAAAGPRRPRSPTDDRSGRSRSAARCVSCSAFRLLVHIGDALVDRAIEMIGVGDGLVSKELPLGDDRRVDVRPDAP
jgi:hypothetical protein